MLLSLSTTILAIMATGFAGITTSSVSATHDWSMQSRKSVIHTSLARRGLRISIIAPRWSDGRSSHRLATRSPSMAPETIDSPIQSCSAERLLVRIPANRRHDGQDRVEAKQHGEFTQPAAARPGACRSPKPLRIHRARRRRPAHGCDRVFTESGKHRVLISKYRPLAEIYAFCAPDSLQSSEPALGVQPVVRDQALTAEECFWPPSRNFYAAGRIKTGDVVGVVAGTQMASGSTNFMRLHLVSPKTERGLSRRKSSSKIATRDDSKNYCQSIEGRARITRAHEFC